MPVFTIVFVFFLPVNLAAGRFTVELDYIPSTVTLLDDLLILIGPYQTMSQISVLPSSMVKHLSITDRNVASHSRGQSPWTIWIIFSLNTMSVLDPLSVIHQVPS